MTKTSGASRPDVDRPGGAGAKRGGVQPRRSDDPTRDGRWAWPVVPPLHPRRASPERGTWRNISPLAQDPSRLSAATKGREASPREAPQPAAKFLQELWSMGRGGPVSRREDTTLSGCASPITNGGGQRQVVNHGSGCYLATLKHNSPQHCYA